MKKKYGGWILALIVLAIAAGFLINRNQKTPTKNPEGEKLQVAASFYPLYFLASSIGGDKVAVINITPAGAEPHDYEPTAEDIAHIENSRILILDGTGLEAWGSNIQKNIDLKKTNIIVTGQGLITRTVMENGKNVTDPHIWLDPKLAKVMSDKITTGFTQADPVNKDYYLANENKLKDKLDELDIAFRNGLKSCAKKDIITSHAAFGYLAAEYGLNQVSISGLSPDAEPSSKQLIDIANFAKKNNIKYIFFESLVSPKLSETIAREVGAQTLVLNPIEGLTNDEIDAGKNYFTEMKNNLKNLQTALECKTS